MTFEGQYLEYTDYTNLGGTLKQTPFNLLEYNARKRIDEKTFGRLTNLTNIPQEVKLCVFELINVLESYTTTSENKGVSSENIDGYSISYTTPNKSITEAKNSELDDIITNYLANITIDNIPVLYRGADVNK